MLVLWCNPFKIAQYIRLLSRESGVTFKSCQEIRDLLNIHIREDETLSRILRPLSPKAISPVLSNQVEVSAIQLRIDRHDIAFTLPAKNQLKGNRNQIYGCDNHCAAAKNFINSP